MFSVWVEDHKGWFGDVQVCEEHCPDISYTISCVRVSSLQFQNDTLFFNDSGSLHTPYNLYDTARAWKIKQAIINVRPLADIMTRAKGGATTTLTSHGTAQLVMRTSGDDPAKFKRDLLEKTRGNLCVLSCP